VGRWFHLKNTLPLRIHLACSSILGVKCELRIKFTTVSNVVLIGIVTIVDHILHTFKVDMSNFQQILPNKGNQISYYVLSTREDL
jgi:hypothetical protein